MTTNEIQQIRDFNRFYTSVIGLLDNHILNSPYSLPEARVLYELYHHQPCTASDVMAAIKMDKGYLSRILKSFEKKGLTCRKQSKEDARASHVTLTAKGNTEFNKINIASSNQIKAMLSRLTANEIKQLVQHMDEIKKILSNRP
jgi:DNA-binding MarR family transcriptional regulator